MAAAAPHRIEIVPWGFWKTCTLTGWGRYQANYLLGGGYCYGGNQNDYIEWEVLLGSGTWTLDIVAAGGVNNRGIATVTLNGSTIGTLDFYPGGNNGVYSITGFTVSTDGNYTLRFTMASKNASSTWYYFPPQLISLRRTGA